jgi:hypothetical protein
MGRLRAARPVAAEPGNHDALFAQIVAKPGDPRLVQAPPEPSSRFLARKVRPWTGARGRVLAGSTLGLAGAVVAIVLALSVSAAPPASAITHNADGSVLVTINQYRSLPAANRPLTAMGIHEQIMIQTSTSWQYVNGPLACVPPPGAKLSGPPLKVLMPPQRLGSRTYHLYHCAVTAGSFRP